MRFPHSLLCLVPLCLAFAAPPTVAHLQFDPAESIAAPIGFRDVELVDLDAAQDLDLVLVLPDAGAVVNIFRNDGAGSFTPFGTYPHTGWGEALAVGDIDGDGDPDLLVVIGHSSNEMAAFLNNGSGMFSPGITSIAGDDAIEVVLGDLDGDGHLDAILGNYSGDHVTVHMGDGTGHFGPEISYYVNGSAFGLALADYDGDFDLDLAVGLPGSYPGPGEVWVFTNDGTGTFGAPQINIAGRGTWAVKAGDMDFDGDLDLIATNRNTENVSYFANQGDGTFAAHQTTPVGLYAINGSLADLDGDGDLDMAGPSNGTPDMHLLVNDGSGGLTPDSILPGSPHHYTSTSGDVDGDGDVDLIAGGSISVELHRNTTPQLDPLLLNVNHVVAGGTAEITARNATPFSLTFVGYSLTGIGPETYLGVLDTTYVLQAPILLTLGVASPAGENAWSFSIPPAAVGLDIWLQAFQYQASSNVVPTRVN